MLLTPLSGCGGRILPFASRSARSGVDIPENRYRLCAGRPDVDFVLALGGQRDAIMLGQNAQRPSNGRSIHLMFLGEFTLRR